MKQPTRLPLLLAAALALPLSNASAIVTWGDMIIEGELDATFTGNSSPYGEWTKDFDVSSDSGYQPVEGVVVSTTDADSDVHPNGVEEGEAFATFNSEGQYGGESTTSDTATFTAEGLYSLGGQYTERGVGYFDDISATTTLAIEFTVSEDAYLTGSLELSWFDAVADADNVDDGTLSWTVWTFPEGSIIPTVFGVGTATTSSTDDATVAISSDLLSPDTDYILVLQYTFAGVDFQVTTDTDNPTQVNYGPNFTANVTVAAVPEPASGALLVAGFAGLLLRRRR